MKSIKALFILSILGLNAVACGDDAETNTPAGGGNIASYVTQCKGFCDAQSAKDCLSTDTLEECKADCDEAATATGDCATKTIAYGDCVKKGADVCTAEAACLTEAVAALAACMSTQ